MEKMKTYRAKSDVSINVVLKSGKSKHVSFLPMTGGGSVFRTADKDVQEALEKHYKFGKLFKLVPDAAPATKTAKKQVLKVVTDEQPAGEIPDEDQNTGDEGTVEEYEDAENADGLRTVAVTCLSDAKEYLADTYGISRTSLRSKAKIEEAAAANGIKFEGLE